MEAEIFLYNSRDVKIKDVKKGEISYLEAVRNISPGNHYLFCKRTVGTLFQRDISVWEKVVKCYDFMLIIS